MEAPKNKRGFICDRDGVIYRGSHLLECSRGFVDWLKAESKQYLFLASSSARSPQVLHQRLLHMGIEPAIDTILVLSGITRESDLERHPYKPRRILKDLGEIPL